MTPAPWIKHIVEEQTLFTTEAGKYVAILTTRLGPDGRLWIMDYEDLQLMLTSPKLLEALKDSTGMMTRLSARYPREAGLQTFIHRNERLFEELEENAT